MIDKPGDLPIERAAANGVAPLLEEGETILWAAGRRSLNVRDWFIALFAVFGLALISLGIAQRDLTVFDLGPLAAAVGAMSVISLRWIFAVTDRRVLIRNSLFPFVFEKYSYARLQAQGVAHHRGRPVIDLTGRGDAHWFFVHALFHRGCIDSVQDIEPVRKLILSRIGAHSPSAGN